MAARAIASLSLTFGLVSIPVRLYSATEQAAAIRFKLMGRGGSRLRQQYVSNLPASDAQWTKSDAGEGVELEEKPGMRADETSASASLPDRMRREQARKFIGAPESDASQPGDAPASSGSCLVERADMVKGYEFEKGKFVLFTPQELQALRVGARQTIDIVSFIPERSVDPTYYDKAYLLAPDKRAAKTYSLLRAAMRESGRCALAKWAWRSKEYVVEIRAAEGGLVLQQLLYADEVRSLADLGVELVPVGHAELKLALQLISQTSDDAYDPHAFVDEEKARILAAVEQKIAGRQVVMPEQTARGTPGQVVDLIAALQASLRASPAPAHADEAGTAGREVARKPAQRAKSVERQSARTGRVDDASSIAKSRARK